MHKRILALPAAALTALVVAGCGSDDTPVAAPASSAAAPSASGSAAASTEHNDADVMFAQMMIPHHRQAIDMAKMAATRAADPKVKELASKIQTAQDPEIQTMSTWLMAWNAPMPTGMPGMDGMDDGSMSSMPGAMSPADMKKLESLSGAAFDKEFLTSMTAHHQGAIQMAQEEQRNGKNPDAVALAKKIVTDQTAEIAEIRTLLGAS